MRKYTFIERKVYRCGKRLQVDYSTYLSLGGLTFTIIDDKKRNQSKGFWRAFSTFFTTSRGLKPFNDRFIGMCLFDDLIPVISSYSVTRKTSGSWYGYGVGALAHLFTSFVSIFSSLVVLL